MRRAAAAMQHRLIESFRGACRLKVLVVASQKGGSGKTTLAGHLAVQAELSGDGPVGLIDVDPQGSLADWWNERTAPNPFFIQTAVSRLADDIRELAAHGLELLVIDTPPALTATIADVIRVADLVLIPTRPSPHDLRSIGSTMELVEHLGKPLVFVVNGAAARARTPRRALQARGESACFSRRHRPGRLARDPGGHIEATGTRTGSDAFPKAGRKSERARRSAVCQSIGRDSRSSDGAPAARH